MPFVLHKSLISVARETEHDDRHSKEWPLWEGIEPVVTCDGRASESAVRTRTGVRHLSQVDRYKSRWMVSGSPSSESRLALDHQLVLPCRFQGLDAPMLVTGPFTLRVHRPCT